jgi:hypothetical protein
MKKVTFSARRPSEPLPKTIDDWVENRDPSVPEPTKRLTIDVPITLHKRIKVHCAVENLVMADELRRLLVEKFPAPHAKEGHRES